jgi:hypothetical protein
MGASPPRYTYMTYEPYVRVPDLQDRGLYRLYSRNLDLGVWDGKEGFIGIRTKFGERFLFKEIHFDLSQSFGTVRPVEMTDTVPEDIEIVEGFSRCMTCGEADPGFDRERGETWEERAFHLSGRTDHPAKSAHYQNTALFEWLDDHLQKDDWRAWDDS